MQQIGRHHGPPHQPAQASSQAVEAGKPVPVSGRENLHRAAPSFPQRTAQGHTILTQPAGPFRGRHKENALRRLESQALRDPHEVTRHHDRRVAGAAIGVPPPHRRHVALLSLQGTPPRFQSTVATVQSEHNPNQRPFLQSLHPLRHLRIRLAIHTESPGWPRDRHKCNNYPLRLKLLEHYFHTLISPMCCREGQFGSSQEPQNHELEHLSPASREHSWLPAPPRRRLVDRRPGQTERGPRLGRFCTSSFEGHRLWRLSQDGGRGGHIRSPPASFAKSLQGERGRRTELTKAFLEELPTPPFVLLARDL